MFELGFSSRRGLFSCPGLVEEVSFSALRVSFTSCAWAVKAAKVAVASPAEPTPKKVRLDSPSVAILPSCDSLVPSFTSVEALVSLVSLILRSPLMVF